MFFKRKSRRSRFFRITRTGWMFLMLIVIMAVVGALKGLNLIYLTVSMMISYMLVTQVLSRIVLHNLSIERITPDHIFSEKPFPVELRITNNKKRFASYSLAVHDIMEKTDLPERYIIKIPAGTTITAMYEHQLNHRGIYSFDGIELSTLYPLDFFIRGFVLRQLENAIVYPKIVRLNPNFLAELMTDIEQRLNRPGAGSEVYGFHKYQPGDDSRDINWKLTAKRSEVTVTKFSQDQNLHMAVVFDNALGPDAGPQSGDPDDDDTQAAERFESAVRFVASISSFFIEKGYKLKLVTHSGQTGFGEGAKHLFQVLNHLALIQPIPESEVTEDIYHPSQLEQRLGILVTFERKPIRTEHFLHTFYAHGITDI